MYCRTDLSERLRTTFSKFKSFRTSQKGFNPVPICRCSESVPGWWGVAQFCYYNCLVLWAEWLRLTFHVFVKHEVRIISEHRQLINIVNMALEGQLVAESHSECCHRLYSGKTRNDGDISRMTAVMTDCVHRARCVHRRSSERISRRKEIARQHSSDQTIWAYVGVTKFFAPEVHPYLPGAWWTLQITLT